MTEFTLNSSPNKSTGNAPFELIYEPNDSLIFPGQAAQIFYDFGDDPKREYQVSEIVTHTWDVDNCLWFHIKWGIGNLTWEPLSNVDDITVLDEYLTLQDIDKVENL